MHSMASDRPDEGLGKLSGIASDHGSCYRAPRIVSLCTADHQASGLPGIGLYMSHQVLCLLQQLAMLSLCSPSCRGQLSVFNRIACSAHDVATARMRLSMCRWQMESSS